jgi:DNA-binding NarL/FixJ family response regulator
VDEPFVGRTAELAELRRQFELAMAQAAAGKTNRQIAAELYISVKTVEFHLAQILARLDVDSRTEIARALAAPGA